MLSIRALYAQGWSRRRIARELGVNRETVARQLREASNPAKAPTGSKAEKEHKTNHEEAANPSEEV